MNTCYISFILIILLGCIYYYKKSTSIENFIDLSNQTRTVLGQQIRGKDDLESTIAIINRQIEDRENRFKSVDKRPVNTEGTDAKAYSNIEKIKTPLVKNEEQVFSNKNTDLVSVDLKNYVHRDNVPDMANFIHKNKMPDMTNYINRLKVPDIKRYILKTSIPSGPDMTKYILKNQVPQCPKVHNINKYILKSAIPVPKLCPDITKFVLKTSVPPIQRPVCPKPSCVACKENKAPSKTVDKAPTKARVIKINKSNANGDKAVRNLIPRTVPVTTSGNTDETDADTKHKVIKNNLEVYKPKLGARKCNVFYKIIKNADIYGAY